jgi:hypothetical protein
MICRTAARAIQVGRTAWMVCVSAMYRPAEDTLTWMLEYKRNQEKSLASVHESEGSNADARVLTLR